MTEVKSKPGTQGSKINKGSIIKQCHCPSVYQDTIYGKGNRVMNGMKNGYRCTCCKREAKE